LKVTGLDGVVNGFMGNIGYSVDEFIKATKVKCSSLFPILK
jgi:hypothetical protein